MSGEFERQWLSDLPEDWAEKRADFLCRPYRVTVDPEVFGDDLVAHYSIPQVQETGGPLIELASDIDSSKLFIDSPTLLVSKLNPRKKTICVAEPHPEYPTLASGEFVAINSEEMDRRYAYYLWCSEKVTDRLSAIVQSVTRSHQRVNPADILKLPWKWTPLETQRRIARFLDEKTARIDGVIEKKRTLLNRLAEKRQALVTRAVTKGLYPDAPMKPSGIDWIGDIPAHWEVTPVKRIAVLESGHTPHRKVNAYWEDCEIPWVSLNDTEILRAGDYISDTTIKINQLGLANSSARMLPERAVVFTRDATIGESAITTRPMTVSQHIIAWLCVGKRAVEEFLLLAIYGMRGELLRLTNGSTIGTIGLSDVKSIRIALPPSSEQTDIVSSVFRQKSELEDIFRTVEKSIEQLSEYRSALITTAVTGQMLELQ